MKNKDILCLHNKIENCKFLHSLIEEKGYQVKNCDDGNEAIELARQNKFLAIVLDSWIGSMSGLYISSQIRKFDRETPIIFFSATPFSPNFEQRSKEGTQTYLAKDFDKIVETIIKLAATNE